MSDNALNNNMLTINWSWGSQQAYTFNPATDKIDLGWFQSQQFTLTEVNGSTVISIPSNQQTYTLTGVSLASISPSNFLAKDATTVGYLTTIFGAHVDSSGTSNSTVQPPQVVPEPANPTPVPSQSSPPLAISGGTTTSVTWSWGSHKEIAFNPATDKLDFGWGFQSGQVVLTESNGSTVVSIPSNEQSYILSGVPLSALSSANFLSNDSELLAYVSGALGAEVVSPPAPVVTPVSPTPTPTSPADSNSSGANQDTTSGTTETTSSTTAYANAWVADQVYTAGDRVSLGNNVYEAQWWTQNNAPTGEEQGSVWHFVGYMDTTPVVPEAPQDLYAASTSDQATMLVWDASLVNGVGTVSSYNIYQDGELVGTTNNTYFKVTGLDPASTHTFSVIAYDEVGASQHSAPITVTTKAVGQSYDQVFSPYIDMSLNNSQNLAKIVHDAGVEDITLAFMLNSGNDQIGWGGIGTIQNDGLPAGSSMLEQIEAVQQEGVNVRISFGGANGSEPALAFSSVDALTGAYQSVIDRYHVNSLDFDIEGGAIVNSAANHMRNEALVALNEANPDLTLSFTLPVLPTGLTYDGINFLAQAKQDGVEIDVVNIMAMDYGAIADSGDMGQDAIEAALATISQLRELGIDAKVGITPMIGINDVQTEVFTIEDANQLMAFAKDNPDIASIGMWSLGRDNESQLNIVSPVTSGISQSEYEFSSVFGAL